MHAFCETFRILLLFRKAIWNGIETVQSFPPLLFHKYITLVVDHIKKLIDTLRKQRFIPAASTGQINDMVIRSRRFCHYFAVCFFQKLLLLQRFKDSISTSYEDRKKSRTVQIAVRLFVRQSETKSRRANRRDLPMSGRLQVTGYRTYLSL